MDNQQKLIILESQARLYLYIAAIDFKFQNVEQLTIKQKLFEWDSDIKLDELDIIIKDAINSLKSKDEWQLIIKQSVETIDRYVDEENKIDVLKDIIEIAISDGDLDEEERRVISSLAETWDLPDYEDIDEYIREVIVSLAQQFKSPADILKEEGFTDEEIDSLVIDDDGEDGNSQVKADAIVLPDEIIVKVYKIGNDYKAVVKDTEFDFTGIIDNPAKLKYAFKGSRLIRGTKNKEGNYNWRVINK